LNLKEQACSLKSNDNEQIASAHLCRRRRTLHKYHCVEHSRVRHSILTCICRACRDVANTHGRRNAAQPLVSAPPPLVLRPAGQAKAAAAH